MLLHLDALLQLHLLNTFGGIFANFASLFILLTKD